MTRTLGKIFAAAVVLFAQGGALSAQEEDATFWPLVPGSRWVHVATSKGKEIELTWKVSASAGTPKLKKECLRLEMEMLDPAAPKGTIQKKPWILYLLVQKDGIVIGDYEGMGGDDFGYLLKFPLRKGTSWENQIFGGPTMKINDALEEVSVPAGKFNCRRIEFINKYPGTTFTTTWWLASGTGLVKIEHLAASDGGASDKETVELKRYDKAGAPGQSTPPPAEEAKPVSDEKMEALFINAKLQVARQNLKSGMKAKAIDILEEIVKTYPKNPQTADARRLLEEARKN